MVQLSVIVPVYNVEKYLEKCLDSLVNQSFENLEILVINDGSTDRSQEILDKFQQKFPLKVRAFKKINGGLGSARNLGIDEACGKYLAFVDSDDYVHANMFKEMFGLAKQHNAEMVICNLQKVDENGKILQKLAQISGVPQSFSIEQYPSVFSDLSYFACNKIFHKSLFLNHRFQQRMHFEDIELIPKLVLNCKKIAWTPNFHYHYLERAGSITKSHTLAGLDMIKAVNSVSDFYGESCLAANKNALENFKILEGIYSFLAYAAFVKNSANFKNMHSVYLNFKKENKISLVKILKYKRFGKNYLLSLPISKQIYYLLYFTGVFPFIKKLL